MMNRIAGLVIFAALLYMAYAHGTQTKEVEIPTRVPIRQPTVVPTATPQVDHVLRIENDLVVHHYVPHGGPVWDSAGKVVYTDLPGTDEGQNEAVKVCEQLVARGVMAKTPKGDRHWRLMIRDRTDQAVAIWWTDWDECSFN